MVARVVLPLALVVLVHLSRGERLQPEWSSWGVGLLQGRRLEMEDRAAVLQASCSTGSEQQHRFWAVYDGHGGSWFAQALSEQLLPAIQSALCNIIPPTSAPAAPIQPHSQVGDECQDKSKRGHNLPIAAGIVQPIANPLCRHTATLLSTITSATRPDLCSQYRRWLYCIGAASDCTARRGRRHTAKQSGTGRRSSRGCWQLCSPDWPSTQVVSPLCQCG